MTYSQPARTAARRTRSTLYGRRRRRAPLAALVLIAMIALISACGSTAPAGTGSGGNNAPAGSGSSGGNTTASKREQGVKFAECMRENGVSDFPDPNAAGEFVYGASVTPAVFDKAVRACKALQPPGTLSAKRSPKQQSAGLKFARCMRENGVNDFPDPINGQPLVDTNRIPSSNLPDGMSILNAAMQNCRDDLAAAARGQ
jgi:hypothetical protein